MAPSEDTPTGSVSPAAAVQYQAVRYIHPMPLAGSPGAPYFDGHNITECLERYEDLSEEHGLSAADMLRRVNRYCEISIGRTIVLMTEYVDGNWARLKAALLRDYEDQDVYQKIFTLE